MPVRSARPRRKRCSLLSQSRLTAALVATAAVLGCGDPPPEPAFALPAEDPPQPGEAAFSGRVPALEERAPPTHRLEVSRVLGDTATFGAIHELFLIGPDLLVIDRFNSPHLAFVSSVDGRVIQRLVRHGEGPKEMRQPLWAQPVPEHYPEAWVYDFGTRRFVRLRLDAPRDSAFLEMVRFERVPYSLLQPFWQDGEVIANGLLPRHGLVRLDSTGAPEALVPLPAPFDSTVIPLPVGRRLANRSFLAMNPSRTRLALVYQFANRIDLLEGNGALYGSVAGPRETEARFRIEGDRFFWEDENQMAYSAATATDRRLYALFSGERLEDEEDEVSRPSRIHVFEWDGDFVAEIELDHEVSTIAVTSDDRQLYGAVEDPYPRIAVWQLPPGPR